MDILFNILYILLFVLCLSVLIVVHELGHFAMAKAFKVYCLEFSIGFGPKLFSFKRKKGETRFSLRSIPFGGFVSMVGEGTETPEGVTIDDSRNFSKIKKWKRAIILGAGVTMNALLALLVFFISQSCFIQTEISASQLVVTEDSVAANAGLNSDDFIYLDSETFGEDAPIYIVDKDTAYYTIRDAVTEEITTTRVIVVIKRSIESYSKLNWDNYLSYYKETVLDDYANSQKLIAPIGDDVVSVSFNLSKYVVLEDAEAGTEPVNIVLEAKTNLDSPTRLFEDIGLSLHSKKYWNTFGQANQNTWNLMGNSSIAIFKGIGSLFTAPQQVGGIVAVGFATTSTLKNFGVVSFLQLWGLISINLAIINLLPFPGLDGWQIFVLVFESISRKEMPSKVKNIVSAVGVIILFALMFALLIKDIIMAII